MSCMNKPELIGPLLGYCNHRAYQRMEQKLRRYGVTPIQCRSLTYLHRQPGPVTQKQLQQHLAVKPSTVNGIVDRLVEKGMLTRSPGEKDGRCRILRLTEAGQRFYDDFESITRQIEDLIHTFDDASNHPVTEDMIDALADDDQAYDDTQVTRPRLQAACYVIDAMGAETRDRLVKSFCVGQLRGYEQLFRPESAGEGLDQVERRYHWFWRCLSEWARRGGLRRSYEAKYRCLFPYAWHVEAALLQAFCERTREHLQTVLARFETPEMVDVPLLVNALRVTMQFERVAVQGVREA